MIAGIAHVLGDERHYHLFDSFRGLPPAMPIDGEAARTWQSDCESSTYFNNCTASSQDAEAAMRLSGVKQYHIHEGWFADTLGAYAESGDRIAILRLDGDWYDSTLICLEALFSLVVNGGLIIVDDYLTWDGCSRAVHDYLSKTKAPQRIRTFMGSVAYINCLQ